MPWKETRSVNSLSHSTLSKMMAMHIHKLVVRVSLGCLLATALGCVSTIPLKMDKPEPDPELGTADFSDLYDGRVVSQSVYPLKGTKALNLMSRVLLSPNLVFEASRSSLKAPETTGPTGAKASAPDLKDALGKPIRISLSSLLLDYLAAKGSVLIAPAITRKSPVAPLQASKGTWVERALLTEPKGADTKLSQTVVFAVRELGMETLEVSVVATHGKDDSINFRPRRSPDEASICGDVTLAVPSVIFSAELVSSQDGRLIARIHERRFPDVDVMQHASIELVSYKENKRKAFGKEKWGSPLESSKYAYVKSWKKKNVACIQSLNSYKKILKNAEQDMELNLSATVSKMLAESLSQLYVSGSGIAISE